MLGVYRSTILTFLVEGNQSLCNGLSDGIGLRDGTTALHTETDIHICETLLSQKENGFHDLPSERIRLEKFKRRTIKSNFALATLYICDSYGIFLQKWLIKNILRHVHHNLEAFSAIDGLAQHQN